MPWLFNNAKDLKEGFKETLLQSITIELGVMVFVKEGIIDQREQSKEYAQKPTKGI